MSKTVNATRVVSPALVRELAFKQLENAIAGSRDIVNLITDPNPLTDNLSQLLGVAENACRIIRTVPEQELKQLTGPLHGEVDDESGLMNPSSGDSAAPPDNGSANGIVRRLTDAERKRQHARAIAHAKKTNYCKARALGCTFFTKGNSYGKHHKVCPIYNVSRLLDAAYQIDTFPAYVRAVRKEGFDKVSDPAKLKARIESEHGSYTSLVMKVKHARKRAKK
jgi:hypothetical protein